MEENDLLREVTEARCKGNEAIFAVARGGNVEVIEEVWNLLRERGRFLLPTMYLGNALVLSFTTFLCHRQIGFSVDAAFAQTQLVLSRVLEH